MATYNFDCIVYVYDKNMNLLAQFSGDAEGLSEHEMQNLMIAPRVTIESNGESSLTFQMLAGCEKWELIKDVENIYLLNGRYYTPMNENSYQYQGEGSVRTVTVTLVETWYLLARQYHQVYDCGLYVMAKATFQGFVGDSLRFTISSSNCTNPGETISNINAWNQVKLWQPKDSNGNQLIYTVLKDKEHAPTGWEDAPSAVAMFSFSVSGNTATAVMKATAIVETKKVFTYEANKTYQIEEKPYPTSLKNVQITTTTTMDTVTPTSGGGTKTHRKIVTSTKSVNYSYSSNTGTFSIRYTPSSNEEISSVIASYEYSNLGNISPGATCWFGYGAEVVDEHTFLVLPKADKKYKLTIDGVEYDDSQVRDSRGILMPRGSAGYAMWAALRGTGWQLGICDVIPKGFNPEIDYGTFNLESDMKDTLYNIQMIQELYGGILDFRSKEKVLNYRADVTSLNSDDYEIYKDSFNQWTGYEFREGKNITDYPSVEYDNNLITKGYILGYNNLNIKKVNGGKSYVTDFSYTNQVFEGYLEQPLIYDTRDEGGMRQLLYWGQKEIKKKSRPRMKITVNAVDIRTTEGHDHETFNIHDIAKVYIKNMYDGQEVIEEKRIIKWTYNAFALWDSTVELGDKTTNLAELFRLVYNKAVEEAPKTNASGQIAVDDIVMEFDWEELGLPEIPGLPDYPGGPGSGGGYGVGGYGGWGNNITNYISLIARQVTENSEAIAGLILEATDLYAQAELFASYRKQLDDMIAETYAGLKLYADELGSSLDARVDGAYQYTQDAVDRLGLSIQGLDGNIKEIKTKSESGFYAQQWWNGAMAHQYSQIQGTVKTLNDEIYGYGQYSGLKSEVNLGINSINKLRTDFNFALYDKNGTLQQAIQSSNQYVQEATKGYAKTSDLSVYAKTTYVDGELKKKVSTAEISKYVADGIANSTIAAKVNNIGANFSANANTGSGYSMMMATTNNTGAAILVYANGGITMRGTGDCIFNISSAFNKVVNFNQSAYFNSTVNLPTTFKVGANPVQWCKKIINGITITYLGHY